MFCGFNNAHDTQTPLPSWIPRDTVKIDVLMVTEPLPVACDDYTANLCVTGSIGRQLASPFLLRNARRVHTGGMSCCAWGASVIMGIRNGLSCLDTGARGSPHWPRRAVATGVALDVIC